MTLPHGDVAAVEQGSLEELCDVIDYSDHPSVLHPGRSDNTDAADHTVSNVQW